MAKDTVVKTIELEIDEATTLVVGGVPYSGTVSVSQEVADVLLASQKAKIKSEVTENGNARDS